MTGKDPKDMTASELLRWLADDDYQSNCQACGRFYASDECGGHACGDWKADIADKIDAELAEARADSLNASLRSGAELWAMANGWPDFREGEDFGAWLDRCALQRPRFEDGEPVQFGELVSSNLFGAVKVSAIEFTENGTHVKDEPDGDWSTSLEVTTSRLKRPAPEVLGADGKPIKVGETVYPIDGEWLRIPLEVSGIESPTSVKVYLSAGKSWTTFHADSLTHTPPDTQERIDRDVHKDECEYFDHVGNCRGCPANAPGESCIEAMTRDLLRRQRELDARKWCDA